MDLIETFGAKIGALSEEKPQRARQLLTAGFRANGVKNKLASKRSSKSDRMLFQLVNRAMVTCLAKPQSNVMVSLFTPCEMLHLQGLHPYSCEGFSSYLSGAMAEQPFLHQAEDTGIPNSLCSYHKVFIGAAQMGLMPKPRFILSTSLACDANTLTFRHLAQFYDVPHFNVDIPFESSPQAVDYVAGQLRQMGEFLTRQTGLPLDDGQLARTVARSQRTMALYHRGLRLRAGRQVLSDLTHEGADLPGTVGIGHTRWATHGEPNDINAHPHVSQSGKIAVVHNGIIENYIELKEQLLHKGYTFRSETDTEVVAQLLDYYYTDCGDIFEAMVRMLHAVDGSYALGIICADFPDRLLCARKDAPLLLGFGEGENFIASDVTAIIRHTRDIAYLDDGELAILSANGIRVYDRQMHPVEKERYHVDWDVDAAEKGGYAHFMLKEIHEQPHAIREATAARIQDGRVVLRDLNMTDEEIRNIGKIYIIACGSSYHVGVVGKYNLERMLRRSVEVCLASEFRYSDPIVGKGDLVIVISQSGETLDTMAAMREAKKRGAHILSIVNVVGSSIARESDTVLYTWAGPEIAVATTKAYSTQMAVLNLLGLYFSQVLGTLDHATYSAMVRGMEKLPEQMAQILQHTEEIQEIAKACAKSEDVFFIGRNLDYALSLEGSLKLKEISYIHSEAYASGELKHGTISLIEEGTLVIALGTYGPLFDKAMSNVVEVQARGAQVLALTTESHAGEMTKHVPMMLTIPDTELMLLPQLGVVPLQLLAYYIALERGCDIDKPRNLAKSVTVE